MKIQIIQLEAGDDHASARDKLSQVKAPRALLVWPRRGRPLSKRLDLELVARHARRRGIGVGLVVFDPEIIALATRVGLPVFGSLDGSPPPPAPGEAIPVGSHARERRSIAELRQARAATRADPFPLSERGRRVALGIAVGSIVLLIAVLIPRASIAVHPNRTTFRDTLQVWIDPDLGGATGSDRVAAERMTLSVTGVSRIATSGQTRLPSTAASGEVTFTNLTDQALEIPEGTGVRADTVRFETTASATLAGVEGAEVVVPILAALSGRSGNVAAGAIATVEGDLGFRIGVSNLEPTGGGQDVLVGAAASHDLVALRSSLQDELFARAVRDLRSQLGPGHALLEASLVVSRVVSEQFDRQPGAAAETIGLEMTLEVVGLAYREKELEVVIARLIPGLLPPGQELIPGTLSLREAETRPGLSAGPAVLGTFGLTAETAERVSFDQIRRLARAAPVGDLPARLRSEFDLDQAPDIRNAPGWLPWLPLLELQIEVRWPWADS